MTKLEHAQLLAQKGFYVFPLIEGGKLPALDGWQRRATRDPAVIARWWTCPVLGVALDRNIGIATGMFDEGGGHGGGGGTCGLLVLDVDNKNGLRGTETLRGLAEEHGGLPTTLEHSTPTGGRHLIYRVGAAVAHRKAGLLGSGLDVRSRGGFIVAPGSTVDAGTYGVVETDTGVPAMSDCPQWVLDLLAANAPDDRAEAGDGAGRVVAAVSGDLSSLDDWTRSRVDEAMAVEAVEGSRNDTAYRVAARLRDIGLDEAVVLGLMEDWNFEACAPPLDLDELERTVSSLYRSARDPQGSARPEADFGAHDGRIPDLDPETLEAEGVHPFDRLNQQFALVLAGGGHHILWETRDAEGRETLEHLSEASFHRYFASHKMRLESDKGARWEPVTKLWMTDKRRRSYRGLCFMPETAAPEGFYNMWRGYSCAPYDSESDASSVERAAVDAFFSHAWENVACRDQALYDWLMTWFAHLVQRPWEKPLVAAVFKGSKGTGKNALLDRVGALLGAHYLSTSKRRHIVGQFNGHMERLLLFVLDEAFWSGDKQAEGELKELITGSRHQIEHKGKEQYEVRNLTRIAIIGNEDWLVPASEDERRYAVFEMGNGRRQDRQYFHDMRVGMEAGGYRLLLRRLLDWPLDTADVNQAPDSAGLTEQKLLSMELPERYWHECLTEGALLGTDFADDWPEEISTSDFYDGFCRWIKNQNIRSRPPDRRSFFKKIYHITDGRVEKYRPQVKGNRRWVVKIDHLDKLTETFRDKYGV